MSITTSEMTPADIAAVTGCNRNGDGMFGNDFAWILILLLFGYGGRGFGYGGGNGGGCSSCATQADLAAGFNNSAVLSDLNDLQLGQAGIQQTLCQGFNGINTTALQGFHGVDNAICTLGYQGAQHASNLSAQLAQCCCDTRAAIQENTTSGVMNTNAISRQISDCCCDIEKMGMQSRYDAQSMNCQTLQAIDKLGDRIIDYMAAEKTQTLRDENQALRLAASQSAQNAYLINQLKQPCPIPAYTVPNPNCCYTSCGGSF